MPDIIPPLLGDYTSFLKDTWPDLRIHREFISNNNILLTSLEIQTNLSLFLKLLSWVTIIDWDTQHVTQFPRAPDFFSWLLFQIMFSHERKCIQHPHLVASPCNPLLLEFLSVVPAMAAKCIHHIHTHVVHVLLYIHKVHNHLDQEPTSNDDCCPHKAIVLVQHQQILLSLLQLFKDVSS